MNKSLIEIAQTNSNAKLASKQCLFIAILNVDLTSSMQNIVKVWPINLTIMTYLTNTSNQVGQP